MERKVGGVAAGGISVVLPVHNEAGNLEALYRELRHALGSAAHDYEIVAVDDGSTDGSPRVLAALAARDPRVRVVTLDGNFGEAAALTAGFHAARFPVVVTLDADGQNDPADVPRLLAALDRPGILAVSGVRTARVESRFVRVWPSRVANWLIARATALPARDCGCGLKAYRAELLPDIALPAGAHRFLPALLRVRPEQFAEVPVLERPRRAGRSHYGLRRTFAVLRDLPWVCWFVRRGQRARREAGIASAVALAVTSTVALAAPPLALAPALVAGVCGMAYCGMVRFDRARRRGVYRLRVT